jgi:glutamate racemase
MSIDAGAVVFIDSGVGGLPYCARFIARNPDVGVVHVADRAAFPYGKKSKAQLVALLTTLVSRVAAAQPALIVLACNAASISALTELRAQFPAIHFVGTVPAVKPAVLGSKANHIGVIGTERTITDGYIDSLAANVEQCAVTKIAAPNLVEFVEQDYLTASPAKRLSQVNDYITRFRKVGADAVVLGCTHFLLLSDEFRKAGAPDIAIYDSIEGVTHRAEYLLAQHPSTSNTLRLLAVTGKDPINDKWRSFAAHFSLTARLFDDCFGNAP